MKRSRSCLPPACGPEGVCRATWRCLAVLATVLAGSAAALSQEMMPLPDGGTARAGGTGIVSARYVHPTTRYAHAVLGDAIEAGGLWVRDASGAEHVLMLPDTSVFEDITPRLADLDGDGGAEAVLIRSYRTQGAALAIADLTSDGLEIVAETSPIGRANRWLNPAGIADYDGDGNLEIAMIVTPHIGGILEVYQLRGRRLVREHRHTGYSNHALGSRALGLSASIDVDGDGVIDLIVPDQSRTRLTALSFASSSIRQIGHVDLGSPVAADILVSGMRLGITTRDGARRSVHVSNFN